MNANKLLRIGTRVGLLAGMLFAYGIAAAEEVNVYDGEWHYTLTPYAWLPKINATLRFNLPPALGGSPEIQVNPSSYLSDLRFAAALTGEARKSDWAFAMDLMYVDLGSISSRVKNVSGPLDMVSLPINASVNTSVKELIAQGVASYTVARNEQGTLDVFGGMRYAGAKTGLDWNLNGELGLLGRSGSLSQTQDLWDGIVGVRGHVAFGDEHRWFVPYYIDVGAGNNSNTTWQGYGGVGYHYSWGDLVLVYRYLYYRTSGSDLVENMHLGGPALALTFRW
jgi:hypothetical protein